MSKHWCEQANLAHWNGLPLLAVVRVTWRNEDTKDNSDVFSGPKDTQYPQIHIVCQMELSTHLITASTFDDYNVNEMVLAETLTKDTPDHNLTMFDCGFIPWDYCMCGRVLVLAPNVTGVPLNKNTQYTLLRSLGRNGKLVPLT